MSTDTASADVIRAIDLELQPSSHRAEGLDIQTCVYSARPGDFAALSTNVFFALHSGLARISVRLEPGEARVLADQLMQCAEVASRNRAAKQAVAP